jgi:hypothetical protein
VPKCTGGHQTDNLIKCETCGLPIDLASSLDELSELPDFQVSWEDTIVLGVGINLSSFTNVHNLLIKKGDQAEEDESSFTVKSQAGETWADALAENGVRFENWIKKTGFYKAKYRFIAADTTDVLAPLVLRHITYEDNTLVFALSADEASNSLQQNTSYVALSALKNNKIPNITCSTRFVEDLPFFIEDRGLTFNDACEETTTLLISNISDIIDIAQRDQRLGVLSHNFSSIFSASDSVYSKPETAISIQRKQIHQLVKPEDIQTAYILAWAEPSRYELLTRAFNKVFGDNKNRLVNMDIKTFEKTSQFKLYDLVLIVGVKELDLKNLESGYKLVVSKNPDLGVPN